MEPSRITCPDKSHDKRVYLNWEVFQGMRIIRSDSTGKEFYPAICPECGQYFEIKPR